MLEQRAFQNSPTPLYSAWKAFQVLPLLVTGLGQIKAMPLLSALSFFSTPSRGLPRQFETRPASFWQVWNSSDPLLFSFFSTSLLTMSHSTRLKAASRPSSIGWSFEDIKIGQLGERWSERRLVLLGSPLRDGQMDGWHVQTVASVSPLSWTQSCQKLCQTHVRQMGSLCSLGFCSVKPPPPTPPSAPSPFIAPS